MCAVVQFVLDLGSVDLHYLSFGERARIGEIGQGVGGGGQKSLRCLLIGEVI